MEGIVTYGMANGGILFNLVLKHPPLERSTRMIMIDSNPPHFTFCAKDACKAHWNYQL
jgi:hypothetical protein